MYSVVYIPQSERACMATGMFGATKERNEVARIASRLNGEDVCRIHAFLRFTMADYGFDLLPGDTEETALYRMLNDKDYGVEWIAEAYGEMISLCADFYRMLKNHAIPSNRVDLYNQWMSQFFDLDGRMVLMHYMASDTEDSVRFEEMDLWWLTEMLHDPVGFMDAINETAMDEESPWWEGRVY